MKKLSIIIGIVTLFAVGVGLAASEYRYELFDAAIAMERQKAGLTEKTIQVDGMDISYLESERKPGTESVVLIHGFGAIKENWLRMAAHMTEKSHVVVLDLPGHGKSTKEMDRLYTIEAQANYVKKILAAMNLDKVHMAGNSMGGAISSVFAARYPEAVKTVTLFDPAGIFDVEAPMQEALKAGKNPLIVNDEKSFDQLVDFAMEKPPIIPWPISSVVAERAIAKQTINKKIFDDIKSQKVQDFKVEIVKIKAPVQIIWGTEDRVIAVGNAQVFDELIPDSTLNIYQGLGHVPMMEVPKRSASDMLSFMEKRG